MIIQLVLINHETGEPIYDTSLTSTDVLSAIDNMSLRKHADSMLEALKKYEPRTPALHKIGKEPSLPDDLFGTSGGDDLSGPVEYY